MLKINKCSTGNLVFNVGKFEKCIIPKASRWLAVAWPIFEKTFAKLSLSKKRISAMNATEIKKYDRFFLFIPLNKKIIEVITG